MRGFLWLAVLGILSTSVSSAFAQQPYTYPNQNYEPIEAPSQLAPQQIIGSKQVDVIPVPHANTPSPAPETVPHIEPNQIPQGQVNQIPQGQVVYPNGTYAGQRIQPGYQHNQDQPQRWNGFRGLFNRRSSHHTGSGFRRWFRGRSSNNCGCEGQSHSPRIFWWRR